MKTATGRKDRSRPRPQGPPLAYRKADLPALTGISASGWANLIASGQVKARRIGRIVLVSRDEVLRITGAA